MANPTLAPKRVEQVAEELQPGWALADTAAASADGTATTTGGATRTFSPEAAFGKTFLLWALIVAAATYGWSQVEAAPVDSLGNSTVKLPGWTLIALLVAFGLAMLTIFKPKAAPITAPLYAVGMGMFLGAISHLYDIQWNGIVLQAVLATFAVFLVCLGLYVSGVVKVTKKFVFVVIAATAGIFVMYLAAMVLSLFGADIAFWNEPTPLGILVSVGICIVAALNLFLDFEMIRRLGLSGAPKTMEWYGVFALTVTMVWLYMEILRLLSLLRR